MADITEALKNDIAHISDLVRTPGADIGQISGLANLRWALFHRLMTVPGTLVHRPLYGVGMPAYQNAQNSFAIQQKLASLIKEQFEQDPRVESVESVSVTSEDGTPQTTKVAVFVRAIGYTEVQMTFMPFSGGV